MASVDVYWIPLGVGQHVVRVSGAIYEALVATVQRRPRRRLFHSALVVECSAGRFVIEVTPVPGGGDRGVVAEGAVGLAIAGRLRLFRYEVRCWRDGIIPDLGYAVDSPVCVTDDEAVARRILELVPAVPTAVWGRDELRAGEMWNSNSVTSWLLARVGLADAAGSPPGRAPGWDAGIVVAGRTVQEAVRLAA